jgi:ubiquinol-cytochrome c reductase cytochrome c subunit
VLRRRALLPRPLRALLAVSLLGGAIAIGALGSGRDGGATAASLGATEITVTIGATGGSGPEPGPAAREGTESSGRRLFVQGCSSCHGYDAQGVPGAGPSLVGVGAAAADFYLRTGRMPLAAPGDQPLRGPSPYTPAQVHALTDYVGSLGGPPVPQVHPEDGDLAEGWKLFAGHCAGCHQIVAQGGMLPGAVVPGLSDSSPLDVAEAVRVGPYVMPVFDHLTPAEIDDVARYVDYTHHPEDRGGWGLGNVGPIPEGMVAWLLAGAALVFAIRLIGERTTR